MFIDGTQPPFLDHCPGLHYCIIIIALHLSEIQINVVLLFT